MPPMLHVGLTGNIASGKSHATQVFAELGAHVIDADSIAHELLLPGTETYLGVLQAFGPDILLQDRTVDRRKLGRIIFRDTSKRLLLNSLIHPEVRAEVLRRMADQENVSAAGIIIVDAALMIESGFYKQFDKIIVVYCDAGLQLQRVIARDGLTVEEARDRMASQIPMEERLTYADYRIETSGTFRQTREQIEAIYRDLILEEVRIRQSGA